MAAIEIKTVQTDGFEMNYFCFGHGKEPLVILPGLSVQSVMGAADAVADAYRLLTDAFTLYVFDRRRDLPAVYSMKEMAQDTAEAIRALGLGPVCLFGTSQGGMAAMLITVKFPALVRRLVLGSTSARITEPESALFEGWINLAKAGDARGLYLAFGEAVYPPEVFEQSRQLLADAAETVTGEELRRFVILAKTVIGFDVIDEVERIACPVLVIGSRDDRVLGGDASVQIAARLRGESTELFLYDSYGHAAYDTAPDYKERLLRFLVSQSSEKTICRSTAGCKRKSKQQ